MLYSRTYGGIIWTTHALDRILNRKIPQEIAWKTFCFPDKTQKGKEPETLKMIKKMIIISSCIDPPYIGSIEIF